MNDMGLQVQMATEADVSLIMRREREVDMGESRGRVVMALNFRDKEDWVSKGLWSI